MSDDLDRLSPETEQDLQFAEYVLGLLSPSQARAVEALALHDPTVRDAIAAWERRLMPLVDLVPAQQPPPVLWRRLALATGIESVIASPPARARRRFVWPTVGAGALAIAASLATFLVTRPAPTPAPLVAALSPTSAPGANFLVRVADDGTATVIALGEIAVPPGRALELWGLAAGASAPVSLGLLPASGRVRLSIPAHAGLQLLVSQEQAGGSPTKAPTTAPIYGGTLTGL